jgi:hypothetical protein
LAPIEPTTFSSLAHLETIADILKNDINIFRDAEDVNNKLGNKEYAIQPMRIRTPIIDKYKLDGPHVPVPSPTPALPDTPHQSDGSDGGLGSLPDTPHQSDGSDGALPVSQEFAHIQRARKTSPHDLNSQTLVNISAHKESDGTKRIRVFRPHTNNQIYETFRRTNESGEYECIRGLANRYKCWKKMSEYGSVTMSVYRWIGDCMKKCIGNSLDDVNVVHIGSFSKKKIQMLDKNKKYIFVTNEYYDFTILQPFNSKIIKVNTHCNSNDIKDIFQFCRHEYLCHADAAVVLAIALNCAQTTSNVTFYMETRKSDLAKWLISVNTSSNHIFHFTMLSLAQLYIYRFIQGLSLGIQIDDTPLQVFTFDFFKWTSMPNRGQLYFKSDPSHPTADTIISSSTPIGKSESPTSHPPAASPA